MMPRDARMALRAKRLGARHRVVYEELGIPYRDSWVNLPDGKIRQQLVASVDEYGCMSRFALRVLEREWGRAGVLIAGGVRLSEFDVAPARDPRPTVLFSGTLEDERKGVSLLLEAAALVLPDRPDLQVWLSGQGDAQRYVRAAPAAVRDHVVALPIGDPSAQGERYSTAWATALPSINDSFGMVLVESLASGTPIVVADHSAPPELVQPGVGTICEPGDAHSLADALRAALTLAEDPATAARCRARGAEYDWDVLAEGFERIYRGDAERGADADP
jgi:phosphatidylinositol alpha-mannosyltransferase